MQDPKLRLGPPLGQSGEWAAEEPLTASLPPQCTAQGMRSSADRSPRATWSPPAPGCWSTLWGRFPLLLPVPSSPRPHVGATHDLLSAPGFLPTLRNET